MKKILDEIIENIPELEDKKQEIFDVINILKKNNPKIFPTKEFKKTLKNRLKWLINLKQNKKRNFLIFVIPIFSFLFIVSWFFYYLDKIDFIWEQRDLDIKNLQKFNEDDLQFKESQETQEIQEIWNLSENDQKIEVELKEDDKTNTKDEIKENIKINNTKNNIESTSHSTDTKNDTIINSKEFNDTDYTSKQTIDENNNIQEDSSDELIDDTQIINIFDALEEQYWEVFVDEDNQGLQSDIWNTWITNDSLWWWDTMFIKRSYVELDFGTYCEQQWWVLSSTWEVEKCIIDKKECMASEFKNWICEFIEIK